MHNNDNKTLLPIRVYILNCENAIISCAQVCRSTCTKHFTDQTCVPLQKVTQAVLWFTFSFSNLAVIYKQVINHFHIHCLPIYIRQYIVGIFNSAKNVNLASKVERNGTGGFAIPQSCQTVAVKKAQKMYTIKFHQELQKDSYLTPKLNTFSHHVYGFCPKEWILAGGSGWLFLHQQTASEYYQGCIQKRIFQIKAAFVTNCYHFQIILCTYQIIFSEEIHHNPQPFIKAQTLSYTRYQNTLKIYNLAN